MGTVIAGALVSGFAMVRLFSGKWVVTFHRGMNLMPDWNIIRQLFKFGLPTGIQGVAMNIGIHFFDLLLWLFGPVQRSLVHLLAPSRMSGCLELERARVRWFLSVDYDDLPQSVRQDGGYAYRSITIDDQQLDLSAGFTDLHTEVYRDILGVCPRLVSPES
jgi:hypothetical protein